MEREFLGRGWRFPVGTSDSGAVGLAAGEADVRESIRIILGTAKGERILRPEFGCDIHDYVFTTVTPTTVNLMETSVREALQEWEPRIAVDRVEASADESATGRLLVSVDYRIRETNNEFNLVYPFYLREG